MRAKYANQMRAFITETREEVSDAYNVDKRNDIAKYMSDHMKNWLDPKPDWAALRSVAFLWALAFSPAAAAQNLTQTLLTTYPHLASKFGDFKAIGAMTRAGTDFTTWYNRGKIAKATDFELRALAKGIQDGTITEAMAPELAGFAEGRTPPRMSQLRPRRRTRSSTTERSMLHGSCEGSCGAYSCLRRSFRITVCSWPTTPQRRLEVFSFWGSWVG
jgi:hypothetical protein